MDELYDLQADVREERNIIAQRRDMGEELHRDMRKLLDATRATPQGG
jgi:hypothetical protein